MRGPIAPALVSEVALRLLQYGSARRAYLLKERVGHRVELMDAIREVARGGSRIDPKVVESLVDRRNRAENSPLATLTSRERDVFKARFASQSPRTLAQTGARLGVSAERVRQIEEQLADRLRAKVVTRAARRR